ncbi:MAG: restriction endonuclease subunit S [Candidatus Levyibacteriota bacterium]
MNQNTMKINDLFEITNAHSKGFDDHEKGEIPFVTNGTDDNGIVGFVKPLTGERVFNKRSICVSSFCEATVQRPPFLPRGNGGSGLIVLLPKEKMSYEELFYYASQINFYKWKFSFGRMVIADRLGELPIIEVKDRKDAISDKLKGLISAQKIKQYKIGGEMISQPLGELFEINYGQKEYESKEDLEPGNTILISSKGEDKGCYGLFDIPVHYKAPIITVPRTGSIGHAFVQEFDCCANSDCLVMQAKKEVNLSLNQLYQIAYQIREIKWKYNYGRKITPERLRKEPVTYSTL